MSEKELQFIKTLKKWLIGIIVSAATIVGGTILVSWQNSIQNSDKIEVIQKVQDQQTLDIKEKASQKSVSAIKDNLEKQIADKYSSIDEKLNIVLSFVAPNYRVKIDTTQ
jgi:hypothetical protein